MSSPKRRRIDEAESTPAASEQKNTASYEEEEAPKLVPRIMPDPILPELDAIASILLQDLQKNDTSLIASALDKLFDLVNHEEHAENNQIKAYGLGAHSIVAAVMNRWSANEDIQAGGCQCMGMFAYHRTPPVVKCGGVEAVVYAMKAFPTTARVQCGGSLTLMNTLSGCDSKPRCVKRVTYRFVKEMDGIPLILKALERFVEEDDVRQGGLGIFSNLSLDSVLKGAIKKAGIFPTVIGILAKYPDDEYVKEYSTSIVTGMFS